MDSPSQAAYRIATDFKEQGYRVAGLVKSIQDEIRNRPLPEHDAFLNELSMNLRGTTAKGDDEEGGGVAEGGGVVLSEAVCKRLGAKDTLRADAEQSAYLLDRALAFMLVLDQLVWTVWKNIAPTSKIKRQTGKILSIPAMIRDMITGTRHHPEAEMNAVFEKSRQLAAGLIGSIGPMGRTYGRKQAAKFAPQGIQEMVRREGGTRPAFMGGEEARYWRKYNELFQDLHEDVIEEDIHRAIVKYTEDLLRNSRI